jgi:hypothetical protein
MANDIATIMVQQSPTINGWICPRCSNYKGKLKCEQGVLICWVGANMLGCVYYAEDRRANRTEGGGGKETT